MTCAGGGVTGGAGVVLCAGLGCAGNRMGGNDVTGLSSGAAPIGAGGRAMGAMGAMGDKDFCAQGLLRRGELADGAITGTGFVCTCFSL